LPEFCNSTKPSATAVARNLPRFRHLPVSSLRHARQAQSPPARVPPGRATGPVSPVGGYRPPFVRVQIQFFPPALVPSFVQDSHLRPLLSPSPPRAWIPPRAWTAALPLRARSPIVRGQWFVTTPRTRTWFGASPLVCGHPLIGPQHAARVVRTFSHCAWTVVPRTRVGATPRARFGPPVLCACALPPGLRGPIISA
jgi:hypothetical protein